MAVVYPTNDDPQPVPQPVHPGLVQEAELHPIWAVVIVGVLAIAAYAVISRLRGTAASSSSTPAAAQTPTTEYVPTRNYFINVSKGGQQPPTPTPTPTPGGPVPPVPGPPGPNPNPGPGNGYNGTPLIPYGDYTGPGYGAGQFHFGQEYTYDGTTYQEGPGSNGILWGVALKPGETPLTQAQWNNIPIAPGGKVELYGPASDYKGGGPPVAWSSDYARQKPVLV
jgi:hypothetical protein